jgi:hypothetical protein
MFTFVDTDLSVEMRQELPNVLTTSPGVLQPLTV